MVASIPATRPCRSAQPRGQSLRPVTTRCRGVQSLRSGLAVFRILLPDDDDAGGTPQLNPFAPAPRLGPDYGGPERPRKLRLLDRGRAVFGSYAKVLLYDSIPAAYTQFGPLSAYPRAQHIRDLYPRLPQSPLPAVITCVASTAAARSRGLALRLIEAVIADLAERGFAAIETYPDQTLGADEASAASPAFWVRCGFATAAEDERYPVMRMELG